MEALYQEGSITLPMINLNPDSGVLKITGRSIPEHPVKFYQPVDEWITQYLASSPVTVKMEIHLDYLNTHSTECVLMMIKKIESYAATNNIKASVLWQFDEDDEDMETLGEDLASLVDIPFEIKEVIE